MARQTYTHEVVGALKESVAIALLLVLQFCCAFVLLYDISASLFGWQLTPISWALYEIFEVGAVLGLLLGVVAFGTLLFRMLRARNRAEETVRQLSGAFMDLLEERFAQWGLTPAEREVALFAIKGFSVAEIANLRQTSEGTVKAQSNAIYRKAGVPGRAQLLSLFIDDLMDDTHAAQRDETRSMR